MIERIRHGWWRFACVMLTLWAHCASAQQQRPLKPNVQQKVTTAVSAAQSSEHAVVLGSAASMGALLILIGIGWIVVKFLRALTGTKPKLIKPVILILIGVGLFILPRFLG